MAGERALRRIGDPVVAATPAGVRIRTRIHVTAAEAAALAVIGDLLGAVYRGELAERIRLGRLDHKTHAAWRAQRKQAVTAVSSSRWAGAIPARWRINTSWGCAVWPPRWRICAPRLRCWSSGACCVPASSHHSRTASRRPAVDRGAGGVGIAAQRSGSPRPAAWRCCGTGLALAEDALAAGRPSITVGGKRLWRNRNHLDAADMTEQQWRDRWDGARMFLTADGESGKAGGNETIRVDERGPAAHQGSGRPGRASSAPIW